MGEAQRERVVECQNGMARPWWDVDGGSETVITRKAIAQGLVQRNSTRGGRRHGDCSTCARLHPPYNFLAGPAR